MCGYITEIMEMYLGCKYPDTHQHYGCGKCNLLARSKYLPNCIKAHYLFPEICTKKCGINGPLTLVPNEKLQETVFGSKDFNAMSCAVQLYQNHPKQGVWGARSFPVKYHAGQWGETCTVKSLCTFFKELLKRGEAGEIEIDLIFMRTTYIPSLAFNHPLSSSTTSNLCRLNEFTFFVEHGVICENDTIFLKKWMQMVVDKCQVRRVEEEGSGEEEFGGSSVGGLEQVEGNKGVLSGKEGELGLFESGKLLGREEVSDSNRIEGSATDVVINLGTAGILRNLEADDLQLRKEAGEDRSKEEKPNDIETTHRLSVENDFIDGGASFMYEEEASNIREALNRDDTSNTDEASNRDEFSSHTADVEEGPNLRRLEYDWFGYTAFDLRAKIAYHVPGCEKSFKPNFAPIRYPESRLSLHTLYENFGPNFGGDEGRWELVY